MDIAVWLRALGLERYEAAFRDNEIDERVLPNLTAEDLKDLGVTLVGHRRRLLDAIAALAAEPPEVADVPAPADAERRQLTVMFCDLVGDGALGAARSRRPARGHRRLSSGRGRCHQKLRRLCLEVHGRRRLGLFRLTAIS
jgi:hypothetical protein